jgi:DNA polymerase-3 subunit alpha
MVMTKDTFPTIRPPDRYVSLHNHSTFSPFDGLGEPKEHIDFVLSNEMDSWALTDHGNGNGLAHAHAHAKRLKAEGRNFRQIYGVEFYFVPDLDNWQAQYDAHREEKKQSGGAAAENDDAGHVVEDADETRSKRAASDILRKRYHLAVTAYNQVGLQNLFTLVKKSFKFGFYRFPRIDFKMLKEHSEGLTVTTACVGGYPSGLIYQDFPEVGFLDLKPGLVDDPAVLNMIMGRLENCVDRFVDAVGQENFFLELQMNKMNAQNLTNRCLIDLSKKTGVPLVVTSDAHYPGPNYWEARELYRKLRPGMLDKDGANVLPTLDELQCELYPKNAPQMWEEYQLQWNDHEFYRGSEELVRDAIERTHDMVWQKYDEVWFDQSVKLPSFDTPSQSAFSQLVDLVKDGLHREGLANDDEYLQRAYRELSDIKFLGFENYFLTLQKTLKVSENGTLPGPGRGSGAGSLVNYLLDITHVDPLKHDLLWERFLHRNKAGWPDIDLDIGNRDVVINAARQLFGDDSVVPVSNFNTLKLKSLVKDVSKFYGIPFHEVNAVTGPLEFEVQNKARDPNMEKSMFVLRHEDCMKYSTRYREFMEVYPQVEEKVIDLFMQNRSIGRHAGGVLICPDLELHMPVIKVRGEFQTSWSEGVNIRNLEENGFLKFDFLGLKQMKMVEDCIRLIIAKQLDRQPKFSEVKAFYDENLNCRYHEPDDPTVFQYVYQEGRWPGIFQFTSTGARKFCVLAKPKNITELAAVTAIYRPGPLKARVHIKYVKARRDPSSVEFDHPVLKDVLGPTYGFIVFQEQFMLLAQKLAGFTPGESDKMRKTLVKKDLTSLGKKVTEKEELRKKFISGAVEVSKMPRRDAEALFEKIAFFSLYGFNKSHAVAYAIASYYGAWLMTHYEHEWLSTCLQSENNNVKKLPIMISEIKKLGYIFSPADINLSGRTWTYSTQTGSLVPPLSSFKGVGDVATCEIIENRPYLNLDHLLYDEDGKWKHSKMNKRCFAALAKMEAFTSLEEFDVGLRDNHRQLHDIIIENYDILKKNRYGMSLRKAKKLDAPSQLPQLIDAVSGLADWSRAEKIVNFAEIAGSVNEELVFPVDVMEKIEKADIQSLPTVVGNVRTIAWGCLQDIIKKTSKNGKTFYRLKVVDPQSNSCWLRVWGELPPGATLYTIWIFDVSNNEQWGASTNASKMRAVVP